MRAGTKVLGVSSLAVIVLVSICILLSSRQLHPFEERSAQSSVVPVETSTDKVPNPYYPEIAPEGLPTQKKLSEVHGQVLWSDGSGIHGVAVLVKGDNSSYPPVQTDPDGMYSIREILPGEVTIKIDSVPEQRGNPSIKVRRLILRPGQSMNGINFRVDFPVSVSGTVVDSSGRPVVGALVEAWNKDSKLASVFTASNGKFRLDNISAWEEVSFRASHDGRVSELFGPRTAWIHLQKNPFLRLLEPASIDGRLSYEDGAPVHDAVVVAEANHLWDQGGRWLCRSNRDGRYVLERLPPVSYTVTVYRDIEGIAQNVGFASFDETISHSRVSEWIALSEGERATLDFSLESFLESGGAIESGETMNIEGTVVDSNLEPIAQATVKVPLLGLERETNASGQFEFKDVPRSSYAVNAWAPNFTPQRDGFEPGDDPMNLVLKSQRKVEGVVLDSRTHEPIEKFSVGAKLGNYTGPGWGKEYKSRHGIVDHDSQDVDLAEIQSNEGRFTISELPRRDVVLFIVADGYEVGVVACKYPSPKTELVEVRISPRLQTIGRVVDMLGRPVVNALVYADKREDLFALERAINPSHAVRTDPRGNFDFGPSLPGTRTFYAWAHGYSIGSVAADGVSEPTIVLREDAGLFVWIHLADQPVEGAKVHVDAIVGRNGHRSTYAMPVQNPVIEPGMYFASGLPAGEFSVRVLYTDESSGRRFDLTRKVALAEGVDVELDFPLDRNEELY